MVGPYFLRLTEPRRTVPRRTSGFGVVKRRSAWSEPHKVRQHPQQSCTNEPVFLKIETFSSTAFGVSHVSWIHCAAVLTESLTSFAHRISFNVRSSTGLKSLQVSPPYQFYDYIFATLVVVPLFVRSNQGRISVP